MMRIVVIAIAVALLAGCGSSPKPRLYTLDHGALASAAAPSSAALTVYVAALSIPDALDRPQLVIRGPASELIVLDQHRWAEPLKTALARVMARQLSDLLGDARVSAYPGSALIDATFRVTVDVQRVDAAPAGVVLLEAVWSVRRAAGGAPLSGRSSGTAQAGGSYAALASAHVQALRAVSTDIAAAIQRLQSGGLR